MELEIHIAVITENRQGPGAYAIIASDPDSARIIHESAHFESSFTSRTHLEYISLIKAIKLAGEMNVSRLMLRCQSELLVNQITGANVVDHDIEDMFNEAVPLLFGFENWEIRCIDLDDNKQAHQMASNALRDAESAEKMTATLATERFHEINTGMPQWTIELLEAPLMDCPAQMTAHKKYPFGPDTPGGICVHATAVAINEGPMYWKDQDQHCLTTICPECECPIHINRVKNES